MNWKQTREFGVKSLSSAMVGVDAVVIIVRLQQRRFDGVVGVVAQRQPRPRRRRRRRRPSLIAHLSIHCIFFFFFQLFFIYFN